MATGDITKQITLIGEIAMSGDTAKVAETLSTMVGMVGLTEIFMPSHEIRSKVNDDIGYLAGYLPAELGNAALKVFGVRHPNFGDEIPDTLGEAIAAGVKVGKQYAKQKQAEAEIAKKMEQAKKLGVMLPESGDTVNDEDAAMILSALKAERARKEGKSGPETSMEAILKERMAKLPALKEAEEARLAKIDDAERLKAIARKEMAELQAQVKAMKDRQREIEMARMLASSETARAKAAGEEFDPTALAVGRYADPTLAHAMGTMTMVPVPEPEEVEEEEEEEEYEEDEDDADQLEEELAATKSSFLDSIPAATKAHVTTPVAADDGAW